MIWVVTGDATLYICSECKERWLGQDGEPRTQEWQAAHSKPHTKNDDGTHHPPVGSPQGFDRHG